ncbi:autotransporter domain-containing protein [Sphingomonas sp. GCM10030256]|uniref:autotransporter domain-containing protein n=1 Tax=Sphingomonas sp. GCM10030256 TaxID=3273427 RepID=UPI003610ABFA
MSFTKLTGALLGASAIAFTAAAPASAQRVDKIVSFGDSYADTGNAVALTPAAIRTQLQTLYPTGRFSGGTNYIDTLSQILNAPIENYAIGGAQTGTGNQNFGLPGFTQETQIFVTGTVPAGTTTFPVSNRVFEPGDLLAVSIGGNDARAYQQLNPTATTATAQAAAQLSVANATANLNALVGAGAPTISFLAGDTGRLPEIATNPAGAAIRSTFSTAFNTGIQGTLAGYAADGVVVHYLDLNAVLDNVIANPTAFGITNGIACPVAPNPTCISTSGAGYLFYADALHLTSDGFEVVARYVAAQLQAPLTLAAPSDLALDTARQFGRTLTTRVDLGSPRDGEVGQGVRLFVTGDMFSRDNERTASTDPFDIDGVGGTAGLEAGFGNAVVGAAVNYTRARARFGAGIARDRSRTVQVGGFAGYALGPVFAQAHAGYGWDNHKLRRNGVVEGLRADADGNHWTLGGKAGYLMPMGAVRIGPVVALDYARAKVDGYTEEGDAALTLNVGRQRYTALTGNLGLEARSDFAGGGIALRPFVAAMVEKDFKGDGRIATFAQTSAPGIVNRWDLGERSKKAYARLTGGASAAILPGASLDAAASATFGKDEGEDVSAHVGFRLGF